MSTTILEVALVSDWVNLNFWGVVDKVRTVVCEHVAEAEAEFYFRIELEVWQIEIASETYAEVEVARLELQYVAAFFATSKAGITPAVIYGRELR